MMAQRNGGYAAGKAAAVARAFQGGGKMDWYLPSKDELHQMYLQRSAIGGFSSSEYWSSSEYEASSAWHQHFLNGDHNPNNKPYASHVRPVRVF
jgi:hypothetical protein